MSVTPEQREDEAMKLLVSSRARLAERLIASLDQEPMDPNAETLWAEEAQRRAQELAADQAEPIPADQALARARATLR